MKQDKEPDKQALLAAWRFCLLEKQATLDGGQQAARLGTRVDGGHRPANRGERAAVTAQGYLAHGLGQRSAELQEALRLLERIGNAKRDEVAVGAVIGMQRPSGQKEWLAVFPGGDATAVRVEGVSVCVLSFSSPIVQQLRGLQVDDVACLTRGRSEEEVEIFAVY